MVFRYPSFSQWPHAGQIWGCLLGVWMLSEGVRMVSECVRQMSEVCRCHINWKKFDYCHTNYMRPLLPVPIFVQKRPHGRYFQGGVVGFISGSTAVFFVLGGQVMDIGKQWGWCWRIFLTWPRYPPTLLVVAWADGKLEAPFLFSQTFFNLPDSTHSTMRYYILHFNILKH